MENNISMPELLQTIQAHRKVQERLHRIIAAALGAEIPDDDEDSTQRSFEEIKKRATIKAMGGDPDADDAADLRGAVAEQVGFGINMDQGLSYEVI